jgi:hydrogenase/urease accessory protein HupE
VLRRCLLVLALAACGRAAAAHPAPYSYVDLQVDGRDLRGVAVVHVFDVAHELGLSAPDVLLDPAVAREKGAALGALLATRLKLDGAAGGVRVAWGEAEPAPDRHALCVPFGARGWSGGRLELRASLFPYDPQHQTFVNVYDGGHLAAQAILDRSRPAFVYYTGSMAGIREVVATFLPAGIHHILIGPDHVAFLVALVVLGGSLARLLAIVTAFTIGHSVTLSLAATGVLAPPASLVEPAIALSIVVVGVDNLLVRGRRDTRDLRPFAAAAFGLVHGFGFASVLQEFGLPPTSLGWSLASFNAGVEIGQVAIVVVVAGIGAAIRHRDVRLAERVAVAASVAVTAAGAWWFAQRVLA